MVKPMRHNFNETENCIYCKKTHMQVIDAMGMVREDCIGIEGVAEIEKDALLIAKVIRLLRD